MTIVGDDETDASAGRIGWSAPLARALIGAKVGDERIVRLPAGEKSYEVIAITLPGLGSARRRCRRACGGSAGMVSAQTSAMRVKGGEGSAAARRCRRSVRHGDQRVSVLANSSSSARWHSRLVGNADRLVAADHRATRDWPRARASRCS